MLFISTTMNIDLGLESVPIIGGLLYLGLNEFTRSFVT
jgi:hypothetical protein